MIPVQGLFEAHLTVADLARARAFYGDLLGFELAAEFAERRVAFYWLDGRGTSMLGLWEVGTAPQRMSLHVAFRVALDDLLAAPTRLREVGVEPRGFFGEPVDEPVVLGWMPAGSLYFHDPDGHLLEYLAMLDQPPKPEVGIVPWSDWVR